MTQSIAKDKDTLPDLKYSIVIPYRDRAEHLQTNLPRLKEMFSSVSYEIIVVEQCDNNKFRQACLNNIGTLHTTGDVIVYHDVDYYPSDNVNYFLYPDQPYYPSVEVIQLNEEGKPYETWNTLNHKGGVFMLPKKLFYQIGGFNPLYKGWGKEDDDTYNRVVAAGFEWKRPIVGTFYALYHTPNHPPFSDEDFIKNHQILASCNELLGVGFKDMKYECEVFTSTDTDIKWLKVTNIQ